MSVTNEQTSTAQRSTATVTEFFDAYRRQDVEAMVDLCTPTARFDYVPFEMWGRQRVLRGAGTVATIGKPLWTGLIRAFPDRIYHVHIKDAIVTLNGRSGILSSHLNFGDPRRGWDFRSPGRGGVNFEEIIRALNAINYQGPLSVEWEDSGMDREHGAREACRFVKELDFKPNERAFDAAFAES